MGRPFGHPIAKIFDLVNVYNKSVDNQIIGLVKTHDAVVKLNSYIIKKFLENDIPAISVQTSALFVDYPPLNFIGSDIVEKFLNLSMIPVLYGDIILKHQKSFSILSGDKILVEFCKYLKGNTIRKVIFFM